MSVIRTKQELLKHRDEKNISQSGLEKKRIEEFREHIKNWETPLDQYGPGFVLPNWSKEDFQDTKLFLEKLDKIMNELASDESNGTYSETFDSDSITAEDKRVVEMIVYSFTRLGYDASFNEKEEMVEKYIEKCNCVDSQALFTVPNHPHIKEVMEKYYLLTIC
jgi:hypothetical protein